MVDREPIDPRPPATSAGGASRLPIRPPARALPPGDLEERLELSCRSGRPLRVKLAIEPGAPSLHLGDVALLERLRAFQDAGHRAVLVIGDATARIGDPASRRPPTSSEQIEANAATALRQVAGLLDLDRCEVRHNLEWLQDLDLTALLQLAAGHDVARLLENAEFSRRIGAAEAVPVDQLFYPLLKALDSVKVAADVEIASEGEEFQLALARAVQEQHGQQPQAGLIVPRLLGIDGRAPMGSSPKGAIYLTASAEETFTGIMRIDDEMMRDYFRLLSDLPVAEIDALLATETNPRDIKERLGREIVSQLHGADAAERAADSFRRLVSKREVPTELPTVSLDGLRPEPSGEFGIVDLVVTAAFAKSRSEARRLVKQGAVSLDDRRIGDIDATVAVAGGEVLRVGRKRLARLGPPR
jgi:tyrosyl-tRNA synthetase